MLVKHGASDALTEALREAVRRYEYDLRLLAAWDRDDSEPSEDDDG